MKKLLSIALTIFILLFGFSGCDKIKTVSHSDNALTVYFFDVGQADCSLLIFPDETVMLIDAGNQADGEKISDYLDHLNISTIDYFVLTHPHEDHIGGAEDIIDSFEISTVCLPNMPESYLPKSTIYTSLISSIEEKQCRTLYLNAGTPVINKDSFNVTAISPASESVFSDMNDWSLVLSVDCFTNRILFMADAGISVEHDIISNGFPIDADILRVGHHGSENSSSEEFLNEVTPLVSVISSGTGNTYNHPHKGALNRLNAVNSTTYRTDTVGTVIAKCYDGGFNIETDTIINLDGNR